MLFDRVSDSLTLDTAPELSLLQENRTTASKICEIVQGLNSLGASINPSSRLHQYVRMFDGDDDTAILSLDYALLESLQFLAIHRALSQITDPKPWLKKVNSASCGQVAATDDKLDSRARSDQFELFTMACLTMAGFHVVPNEPDLRAHIGRDETAFAAKRLRSVQKLRRNLHDACKQLAKHRVPGFAVIDLSFVELIGKPVYIPRLGQQQVIAKILLDGFAEEHQREIFDAAERPYVLGVMLHASVVGRSVQPVTRFVSRRWLLCAAKDSEVARIIATALQLLGQSPKAIGTA